MALLRPVAGEHGSLGDQTVVASRPSPCSRDCRRLAALKPGLRKRRKNLFAPAYGEYLEVTQRLLRTGTLMMSVRVLRIGPQLERSALLRVEVSFSFGG